MATDIRAVNPFEAGGGPLAGGNLSLTPILVSRIVDLPAPSPPISTGNCGGSASILVFTPAFVLSEIQQNYNYIYIYQKILDEYTISIYVHSFVRVVTECSGGVITIVF